MNMGKFIVNGRKTINYLKKNGLMPAYYAAKERIEQQKEDTYQYVAPSDDDLEMQKSRASELYKEIRQFLIAEESRLNRIAAYDGESGLNRIAECDGEYPPTFSLLVPAYETKQEYLFALLDSLRLQTYPYWELVLVDASQSDAVACSVKAYERQYPDFEKQLCFVKLDENKGISENTNQGLAYCKGTYICLVDHDDLLAQDALYYMAEAIINHSTSGLAPAMIYSDEDKCNGEGTQFYDHNDKYNFNLDLILSNNYICHLTAIQNHIFRKLQERPAFDGAQDYDLVLRVVSELIDAYGGTFKPGLQAHLQSQIVHVPRVLYHWRCHNDSTAQNTESKRYAYEAGLRAVEDFLNRHKLQATVEHSLHLGFYKVTYEPDMIAARGDVAVVGGRLLDARNKMLPCVKNHVGEYLYAGLHKKYSGRMHRFSLLQDVEEIDLRNAKIADCVKPLLSKVLGEDCTRWIHHHVFDAAKFAEDMKIPKKEIDAIAVETRENANDTGFPAKDKNSVSAKNNRAINWKAISSEFCRSVRLAGYTIAYDPTMEKKTDSHTEDTGVQDA